MGIISYFTNKHKEHMNLINTQCDELLDKFSKANDEASKYLANNDFIELSLASKWKTFNSYLFDKSTKINAYKKAKNYSGLVKETQNYTTYYNLLEKKIIEHNELVSKNKIAIAYDLIGLIEGKRLDNQQMLCIVNETHNHLIIAGAGTGKTTTVVGKIKYLLKSQKCKPEDILVLSFTNASATEMSERINKETNCKISASTFHKLGLSIITKVEGIKPKITQINLKTFIKEQLDQLMKDKVYMRKLNDYLIYNKIPYKSEFEFNNKREYDEYLKLNPPITLLGETVKSYGEMDIANYLFQNGVNYKYEAEYKFDTRTKDYSQYHPDFYLPDYDIYIEYFGINSKGEVPSWFTGKNGKSATQTYLESMNWKFNLHKNNSTKMIACYSYQKMDGTLLDTLNISLTNYKVPLVQKTQDEIWNQFSEKDNSILDGIIELFETVINLLKSNNYSIEHFKTLTKTKQQLSFIDLIEPLYKAYDKQLELNHEIDFNDMINLATKYVKEGKLKNHYSYVIVDEYQDISKARYNLLAALRESYNYDLFCVGDDWQSIYRFAGSDINYILDFKKYWGPTTISKIETTYRFTKSLIEISGHFITRNPAQIQKNIKGMSNDERFSLGEISGYTEKYSIDFMALKMDDLPKNSTIFLIGRYSFDFDLIKENSSFTYQYNNVSGFIDVKYKKRPDLTISFMTAHKSKGLQADYVFIINNKDSRMGFPSRIQDDPILDLLLDNNETFPFAEERRLYYVALTRAKVKAFIVVQKDNESIFAMELHNRYEYELKQEQFECPLCGGKLIHKSGPYGDFFGCENYQTTGCKYIRRIHSNTTNNK